jgi:carbonic anhydrase
MFEFVYRYDPDDPHATSRPADPSAARRRLEEGNAAFADLLGGRPDRPDGRQLVVYDDLWAPPEGAGAVLQQPFAAVLGCSDARVPTEIVFAQGFNDLFVVRVAGNVLGAECLGSLDYALSNLDEGLRLVVVLGHSQCGAVTGAVDSFLDPSVYLATAPSHPVRAVLDKIMVSVRGAQRALEAAWGPEVHARPGYRAALIDTAVGLNTALMAATVRQEFRDQLGPHREVVYGIYDLATRRVGVPLGAAGECRFVPGLLPAPDGLYEFHHLGVALATSPAVRDRVAVA